MNKGENKENIVLKGFQAENNPTTGDPTTANQEVSTVTLGLNGSLDELKAEVNEQWIADKKEILFQQGFELITADAISGIAHNPVAGQNGEFTLVFKIAAGKYFGQDGNLANTEGNFSIKVKGISGSNTAGTTLKEKFGKDRPWAISGIDPKLSLTIAQAKTELAKKSFIYKYMKHFLTGDFKLITQESDLFKGNITVTEENGGILKVEFQIPENKTVTTGGATNTAAVQISFKLKEFATN